MCRQEKSLAEEEITGFTGKCLAAGQKQVLLFNRISEKTPEKRKEEVA